MIKKYDSLLERYSKLIELIYGVTRSGDYTPDYMTYDFRGYRDDVADDEVKEYLPHLNDAVKHAELYYKALTNDYNYIFG